MTQIAFNRYRAPLRLLVSLVSMGAIILNAWAISVQAQRQNSGKSFRLSEDQRILHVLNRLGFGARPGDVERVRAMGLETYINQQLSPEKISDAVSEAKVRNLATLNMTTAELYEKYPQPGLLLRQLERRGELPAGLAAARDSRSQAAAPETAARIGKG